MTQEYFASEALKNAHDHFNLDLLCLPKAKKNALKALYAFSYAINSVEDQIKEAEVAQAKLQWWHREIEALFNQTPSHPLTKELLPAVKSSQLDKACFIKMLDGAAMALKRAPYADFKSLSLYCSHVAGARSQLATQIFGYTNKQTLEYAEHLGIALHLIKIICTIGEDALKGRVYLPIEEQIRFGVYSPDLLQLKSSPELESLIAFQANRARECFQEAIHLLPRPDHFSQIPSLAIAHTYLDLLGIIEKNGFDTLNQKYTVAWPRQVFFVLATYVKGLPYLWQQIKQTS